jgi:hypothetical protein
MWLPIWLLTPAKSSRGPAWHLEQVARILEQGAAAW